jgi:hypothetical protein
MITGTREQLVDKELTHVRVEIERVPIGRTIEVVPSISQEGDTTIIPVVEEIVVVERRLVLKEEVRIRRVTTKEQHQETVVLRQQEALITREEADRHSGVRKLCSMKVANPSPIRSLLFGTIAVCGIGRPSGPSEKSGDREPIGERPDHGSLGGRPNKEYPEPRLRYYSRRDK